MKSIITIFPVLFAMLLTGCQTTVLPVAKPTPNDILQQSTNQTLIIMYQPATDKNALMQVVKRYQAVITHEYPSLNGMAIIVPAGTNVNQAIADFRAISGVTSVEKDAVQTIQ